MHDPLEWARTAGRILEPLTSRWAIAGALAAVEYRRAPRGTVDADILVEWVPELPEALEREGFTVQSSLDPDVGHPHLLIAKRGGVRVDFLIPIVPYQELALDRAKNHVLTVEDVIIHKLVAWRPRDQDDVLSILAAGHDLDRDYIEEWAREWEVLDRWREATGPR